MQHFHTIILTLMLMLSGMGASAQEDLSAMMRARNEFYFSLPVTHPEDVVKIGSTVTIDQIEGNTLFCYANNNEFDALSKMGYRPTLLTPPSMLEMHKMWDGSNRTTYDWDAYPTYEAYEQMMFQYGTDHPDHCEIIEMGTLPSDRKILLAHLHNGSGNGKPRFLYTSTMHGDEVTGMMLMLRLIDYLLTSNDTKVQNIMDNIDIYICPCTNPDGTYHGGNNTVYGASRYNANGIDLNRHFPDFREGPHPDGASHYESEAQWFMELAQEKLFTMGANYHGGSELVNYPWDTYAPKHADDDWWIFTSQEYVDFCHAQNNSYMQSQNHGITNGYEWYSISGSRQDYMNYYSQCRESTIECSMSKTPSATDMPMYWNYNREAMLSYLEESLYGFHGTVTDSVTGQPLVATVTITGHDKDGSSVTSHMPAGDYHRPIKAGTYTVTYAANGYYPKSYTLTVADHQTTIQDVKLVAGEGIIPDFTANVTEVPLGGSVNFTDATWGANITSWAWQFEGGTPATSDEQNPGNIVYNEVGSFDVTLTVTNANGESQSITKPDFITASESYNMQNGTITTCSAMFYDSGGATGNYGNDEQYTLTIKPTGSGRKIEVSFQSFDIENGYDILKVYDGSSTSATLIGEFTGTTSPGTIVATNEEGALTFFFKSDFAANRSGWAATLRCIFDNPITLEVTADPEVINEGESSQLLVVANGGNGNYSYSWEPVETLSNPNIANPVASPTGVATMTYKVVVTDTDGNSAEGSVEVSIHNVSVEENILSSIKIYPNPSQGALYIESKNNVGMMEYSLLNSLGQSVSSLHFDNFEGTIRIATESLSKGIYFLHLSGDKGTTTQKIVIE